MNKYYIDAKIELKSSFAQYGENANEIRLIDKALIEEMVKEVIKNNDELNSMFFDSKPKVRIKIERADEYNGNKKRIKREMVIERIKNYDNRN